VGFQGRQIFHEMVGHALVSHVIVAHRFCTFQAGSSRAFGPQSEKKREHAGQDHSAGDDQERQILAGLPSTGFSAAFEVLHDAAPETIVRPG
jgi:hypothetical protein